MINIKGFHEIKNNGGTYKSETLIVLLLPIKIYIIRPQTQIDKKNWYYQHYRKKLKIGQYTQQSVSIQVT